MLETRLQHVLSLLGGNSSLALRIRARLAAEADYRSGTHAVIVSVLAEAKPTRAAEVPVGSGRGGEPGPPLPADPALAATGPSMTVSHGSVNIAVPGPNDSLWFYWAVNGSAPGTPRPWPALCRETRRPRPR